MTRYTIMLSTMLLIMLWLNPAAATNVEDTLTMGMQAPRTASIRPLDPEERDMLSVYNVVYESLIVIDDNYLPSPCLAESWEQSGNGKTWTFHLRTDVFFSDGTEMLARDVVATMEYILERANDTESNTPGYYSNLKYFVDKVSAPDDHTVVVRAKRSYFGLLYAMVFPVLKADQVRDDHPYGTGPYVITEFIPGSYLTLDVSSTWWRNQPQVKHISCVLSDTPSKVIEDYQYARVDGIFTRSIAAAQYKSGANSLAIEYRTNQLEVLLMNHSSSRLASEKVRKAIRYAVDVDEIASSVYMGMVIRTDTPLIPGTWTYNDTLYPYFETNLEKAQILLAEDGWEDSNEDGILDRLDDEGNSVSLRLNLYVYEEPDNNVRVETAQLIASQLAQVGIAVNITTMSMNEVHTKLSAGSFNLVLCSFAMDPCPDPGFMLIQGNSANYCRYKSSHMTELFQNLRASSTQDEYRQYLMEIQQTFAEDCPFLCMFYRAGSVLTRKMYTTTRDVRELYLLKGIESFKN